MAFSGKIPKLTILNNTNSNTFISTIYNRFKPLLNQYSITFANFNDLANPFILHQNEYVENIKEAYKIFKQTHYEELSKKSPFPDIEYYIYYKFTLSQDSNKYYVKYDKIYEKLINETINKIVSKCNLDNPDKTKNTYNNIAKIFYCFTNLDI